jgi:hypothetical protein
MTSNEQPETTDEFTERTLWRDALDNLRARLRGGDEIDQTELAQAMTHAQAEQEVEAARLSQHERRKAEQDRAAAREQVTARVADLEPDARAASRSRVERAWTAYLDACEAEQAAARDYSQSVRSLIPLVSKAYSELDDDNHTVPGGVIVDGKRYAVYSMSGVSLPHRESGRTDYRRDRIDRAS